MNLTCNKVIFEDCKKSCTDIECFSILDNQSIFVSGGTGFMGKWITEMVSYINETGKYNIKLYLLGRDISKFKDEVPHLAEKPFVSLIEQDVRYLHNVPSDVNYIIHAAGTPDNREHVSHPLKTIETFYKGTQSVLDAATRLPDLRKIVHISSHQVYGRNDTENLINEHFTGTLEPITVSNSYAESKRISETLCSYYRNFYGLPINILRPFSFIGPYQDLEKPWAINSFIRDGLLNESIRILGNGLSERSYLYASDMAYWIVKSLISEKGGENYNLGSRHAISLNKLADIVKEQFGYNINIISKSAKDEDIKISRLVPNVDKIKKALGVKENFSLDEAIFRTIFWNKIKEIKK
jgi:dTDP-glucose 4,6-dehydratase